MFKRSIAVLMTALFVLLLPAMAFAGDVQPTPIDVGSALQEVTSLPSEAPIIDEAAAQPQATDAPYHEGEPVGSVTVSLENNTYTEGAPWTGVKLNKVSVPIYGDSTMMNAVTDALQQSNVEYVFNPDFGGYITSVAGITAGDGAATGGWMLSQNDWFTEVGAGDISVANGRLTSGDSISLMYSMNYGVDLGSDFSGTDKSVKSVDISAGKLNTAFKSGTASYTLYLPKDVKSISIIPTATNKNFQVRTSVDKTEYARGTAIPVKEGSIITVKCGDPAWPTMNAGSEEIPAKSYTFTATYKPQPIPKPANLKATATKGGAKVTWSKSAGANAYQVYRSEKKAGGYKLIKATKSSTFTDSGLKSGKLYYYKVIPYSVTDGVKTKGATAGPAAVRPK